jgi:hypothetical protein
VELPVHLKLIRNGKSMKLLTSPDGQHWGEPKFTREMPFGEGAVVGMFVCSGNTFASSTARFGDVQIID